MHSRLRQACISHDSIGAGVRPGSYGSLPVAAG
jgi:hypothetical protein